MDAIEKENCLQMIRYEGQGGWNDIECSKNGTAADFQDTLCEVIFPCSSITTTTMNTTETTTTITNESTTTSEIITTTTAANITTSATTTTRTTTTITRIPPGSK